MHSSSTFSKPMSSPLSVSMTTESSGASASSCGGFVPRSVRCAAVISATPALEQAASVSDAPIAAATSTG